MYLKRIAIASLLAFAIFGVIYGFAASLSISNVQYLGSGSTRVSNYANVDKVNFDLSSDGYSVVGVDVKIVPASGVTWTAGDTLTVYVMLTHGYTKLTTGSASYTITDTDVNNQYAWVDITVSPQCPSEYVDGITITIVAK